MPRYTQYQVFGYAGVALLAFAFVFMKLDWSVLFFVCFPSSFVCLVCTFFFRCPNCKANLVLTSKERIRRGAIHECSRCGFDLRSER